MKIRGGHKLYIKDLCKRKPVISLEVFPPKPDAPLDNVLKVIEEVQDLKPDFISVTYGAGGNSRAYTVEIANLVKNKYNIEALAHLTCISSTKKDILNLVEQLKEKNIKNILALRGDLPQNQDENPTIIDYQYAQDLIKDLQTMGEICLGAACYPEGHLESPSLNQDLKNLKAKVDSGVDFLITQLFFDNQLFYNFLEKTDISGISCPISAGIMPVINKKQIERITNLCGATLTPKFKKVLEKYEHKPEALKEAGIFYATEQIIDLLANGVDGIHLYGMNRPEVVKQIFTNIDTIRSSAYEN